MVDRNLYIFPLIITSLLLFHLSSAHANSLKKCLKQDNEPLSDILKNCQQRLRVYPKYDDLSDEGLREKSYVIMKLIWTYKQTKQYVKAIKWCTILHKDYDRSGDTSKFWLDRDIGVNNSQRAHAYYVCSLSYYHNDQNKIALAYINNAIRRVDSNGAYYDHKARLLFYMKKYHKSIRAAEIAEVLFVKPENKRRAVNGLVSSYYQLGKLDEAKYFLKKTLDYTNSTEKKTYKEFFERWLKKIEAEIKNREILKTEQETNRIDIVVVYCPKTAVHAVQSGKNITKAHENALAFCADQSGVKKNAFGKGSFNVGLTCCSLKGRTSSKNKCVSLSVSETNPGAYGIGYGENEDLAISAAKEKCSKSDCDLRAIRCGRSLADK